MDSEVVGVVVRDEFVDSGLEVLFDKVLESFESHDVVARHDRLRDFKGFLGVGGGEDRSVLRFVGVLERKLGALRPDRCLPLFGDVVVPLFGAASINFLDVGMDAIEIPESLVSCSEPRVENGIHVEMNAPILVILHSDNELGQGMTETSKKVDESLSSTGTDLRICESEVLAIKVKGHIKSTRQF